MTQPSNVQANAVITPSPQVGTSDLFGNLIASGSDTITLTLNPGSGSAQIPALPLGTNRRITVDARNASKVAIARGEAGLVANVVRR